MATLQEQIAIFQNLSFIKTENPEQSLTTKQVTLQINTTDQINTYLADNNIDSTVLNQTLLYLQTSDDGLDALIFIYSFNNEDQSSCFYNFFSKTLNRNLFLYKTYVIHKGVNKFITSSATNYYYFTKFCNGLK